MGRPPRADEANGIYHMLNRGNRREPLFHKTEDFEAFERMMVEAIERSRIKLYAYCLMPNHCGIWWSARRSTGRWGDSASGWI